MKKILSVFLVAGLLTACDDSKKEETTTTTTTTTDTAKVDDKKVEEKTTTTTTTANTTAKVTIEAPKFADAEAQKFADDYVAFVNGAAKMKADSAEAFGNKRSEFVERQTAIMPKLGKTPDEQNKFSDFVSKANDALEANTEDPE